VNFDPLAPYSASLWKSSKRSANRHDLPLLRLFFELTLLRRRVHERKRNGALVRNCPCADAQSVDNNKATNFLVAKSCSAFCRLLARN
jgi:hypothetical protein